MHRFDDPTVFAAEPQEEEGEARVVCEEAIGAARLKRNSVQEEAIALFESPASARARASTGSRCSRGSDPASSAARPPSSRARVS